MGIFWGLLGLGLVVFIHELGHLLAAKWHGILVKAFSVGFGPAIFHFTYGQTVYKLSLIPLGGYCQLDDDNFLQRLFENKISEPKKNTFWAISWWKQFTILLAGPLFNAISALFALTILFFIGYQSIFLSNKIAISPIQEAHISREAGLRTGDNILFVNQEPIEDFASLRATLEKIKIYESVNLQFERDGEVLNAEFTPLWDHDLNRAVLGLRPFVAPVLAPSSSVYFEVLGFKEGQTLLSLNGQPISDGLSFPELLQNASYPLEFEVLEGQTQKTIEVSQVYPKDDLGFLFALPTKIMKADSLPQAFIQGVGTMNTIVRSTLLGLLSLITLQSDVFQSLLGPIGIVQLIGETMATGTISPQEMSPIRRWIQMLAYLSTVLFVMNLLPIPPLDGGQIGFATLRRLFPRLPVRVYRIYYYTGALLLFALIALALFGDILRLG